MLSVFASSLLLLLFTTQANHAAAQALNSIAFYYGDEVPVQQLANFDTVVVNEDSDLSSNTILQSRRPRYFAYTSIGEVSKDQSFYNAVPKNWIIGRNNVWDSDTIDQSAPGWPAFFANNIVGPLWQKGFRGFFIDTMDSYEIAAPEEGPARQRQLQGMINVIGAVKRQYPTAQLIFNRGFEILPQVHNMVYAVAFESLYKTWDQSSQSYGDVSADDRQEILEELQTVKSYGLPVIAIDYCNPSNRQCATQTASRIRAQGFIPYVSDGNLQTVGTS